MMERIAEHAGLRGGMVALLLLVALLIRGKDLDTTGVQNDEQIWHARSVTFVRSLLGPMAPEGIHQPPHFYPIRHVNLAGEGMGTDGRWPLNIVMPATHPGTPVGFWIGLAAIYLAEGGSDATLGVGSLIEVTRYPGVVFGVLLVLIVYLGGMQLFGFWPAFAGAVIAAFDPFLLGHSRLARLDLSLALWMTGAIVFWLCFLASGRLKWLVLSALFGACSIATNPYGLFAIPVMGLHGLIAWRSRRTPESLNPRRVLTSFGLLLLLWGIFFVLVYPNLWPNPPRGILEHARFVLGTPHASGERSPMPAAPWFYVVHGPTHLHPGTAILALSGLLLARRTNRPAFAMLMVWAGVYLALLSLPPGRKDMKNFLPLFAPIALFGGYGLISLADAAARRSSLQVWLRAGGIGALVAWMLLDLWMWWPYPTLYTWPILDDPQGGRGLRSEIVATGEGVREAIAWIHKDSGPNARISCNTGINNAMYYHDLEKLGRADLPEQLADYDYSIVLTKIYYYSADSYPLNAIFHGTEPARIIKHRQIECARIYRLNERAATPAADREAE